MCDMTENKRRALGGNAEKKRSSFPFQDLVGHTMLYTLYLQLFMDILSNHSYRFLIFGAFYSEVY